MYLDIDVHSFTLYHKEDWDNVKSKDEVSHGPSSVARCKRRTVIKVKFSRGIFKIVFSKLSFRFKLPNVLTSLCSSSSSPKHYLRLLGDDEFESSRHLVQVFKHLVHTRESAGVMSPVVPERWLAIPRAVGHDNLRDLWIPESSLLLQHAGHGWLFINSKNGETISYEKAEIPNEST